MTSHKPLPSANYCLFCGGRCVRLDSGQWMHIERYDPFPLMLDDEGNLARNLSGHPIPAYWEAR